MAVPTYTARCFYCDWGLTQERPALVESAQEHVGECPGPVIALNAVKSVTEGRGELRFWSPKTRCGGCGLPHSVCVCQRVDGRG